MTGFSWDFLTPALGGRYGVQTLRKRQSSLLPDLTSPTGWTQSAPALRADIWAGSLYSFALEYVNRSGVSAYRRPLNLNVW